MCVYLALLFPTLISCHAAQPQKGVGKKMGRERGRKIAGLPLLLLLYTVHCICYPLMFHTDMHSSASNTLGTHESVPDAEGRNTGVCLTDMQGAIVGPATGCNLECVAIHSANTLSSSVPIEQRSKQTRSGTSNLQTSQRPSKLANCSSGKHLLTLILSF
jgi:hypothetical protein